jgi:hypothetical protein
LQSDCDGRIPVAPIEATAREQSDAPAILSHNQPVAVVLDFMNPLLAAGRPRRERRITGLDKARRQSNWSTRGTPLHPGAIAIERGPVRLLPLAWDSNLTYLALIPILGRSDTILDEAAIALWPVLQYQSPSR